jgi:hypothetical protein
MSKDAVVACFKELSHNCHWTIAENNEKYLLRWTISELRFKPTSMEQEH